MKKITGVLILTLLLSSCSLFQKPSMNQDQIDVMTAENTQLKAQANKAKDLEDQLALARMQLDEAMLKLSTCEEAAKSRVHIIVGAFKTSSFADEYSATVKKAGYDGKIIAGPYSFTLVSASSYENLPAALSALNQVRESVIETAWIYME